MRTSATDHAYKWAYKLYEWHATAIEEGTYVDYKDALLQSEASYREILERRAQAEEERKQKARENLERMREERKERNRLWAEKVKSEYEEYLQSDVIKKSRDTAQVDDLISRIQIENYNVFLGKVLHIVSDE